MDDIREKGRKGEGKVCNLAFRRVIREIIIIHEETMVWGKTEQPLRKQPRQLQEWKEAGAILCGP